MFLNKFRQFRNRGKIKKEPFVPLILRGIRFKKMIAELWFIFS